MQVNSIIDAINQTSSEKTGTSTSTSSTKTLDFMEMLMTQMTHQNPMEPMDDSEMMSQFAQLNSLQTLQEIKTSMQKVVQDGQAAYAASLLNKQVSISTSDGNSVEGKITGFSIESGTASVLMGDESYPLDDVVKVWQE